MIIQRDEGGMVIAKASEVKYQSIDFRPSARCRGVLNADGRPAGGCTFVRDPSRETTQDAKTHARHNPGHAVVVERLTQSVYWVDAPAPAVESPDETMERAFDPGGNAELDSESR